MRTYIEGLRHAPVSFHEVRGIRPGHGGDRLRSRGSTWHGGRSISRSPEFIAPQSRW